MDMAQKQLEAQVKRKLPELCKRLNPTTLFISIQSELHDNDAEIIRKRLENNKENDSFIVYSMHAMLKKYRGSGYVNCFIRAAQEQFENLQVFGISFPHEQNQPVERQQHTVQSLPFNAVSHPPALDTGPTPSYRSEGCQTGNAQSVAHSQPVCGQQSTRPLADNAQNSTRLYDGDTSFSPTLQAMKSGFQPSNPSGITMNELVKNIPSKQLPGAPQQSHLGKQTVGQENLSNELLPIVHRPPEQSDRSTAAERCPGETTFVSYATELDSNHPDHPDPVYNILCSVEDNVDSGLASFEQGTDASTKLDKCQVSSGFPPAEKITNASPVRHSQSKDDDVQVDGDLSSADVHQDQPEVRITDSTRDQRRPEDIQHRSSPPANTAESTTPFVYINKIVVHGQGNHINLGKQITDKTVSKTTSLLERHTPQHVFDTANNAMELQGTPASLPHQIVLETPEQIGSQHSDLQTSTGNALSFIPGALPEDSNVSELSSFHSSDQRSHHATELKMTGQDDVCSMGSPDHSGIPTESSIHLTDRTSHHATHPKLTHLHSSLVLEPQHQLSNAMDHSTDLKTGWQTTPKPWDVTPQSEEFISISARSEEKKPTEDRKLKSVPKAKQVGVQEEAPTPINGTNTHSSEQVSFHGADVPNSADQTLCPVTGNVPNFLLDPDVWGHFEEETDAGVEIPSEMRVPSMD